MRNIYFFETKAEAKVKLQEMKKKGNKVEIFKESTPYKTAEGKLLYYSVVWTF